MRASQAMPTRSPSAKREAVGTQRVDDADDLVAGDDVGAVDGEVAFGDVEVGPAHPARRHPHPDLTRARDRGVALDHPQGVPAKGPG